MTHPDADALALAAMNESGPTKVERDHLAECPACTAELAALRRTVRVAREGRAVKLENPADAVWDRIHSELALTDAVARAPRVDPAADAPTVAAASAGPRVRAWKVWLPFAAVWIALRGRNAQRHDTDLDDLDDLDELTELADD